MDQIPLSLNGHFYQTITPGQVTHRLTDDGFSHFDYGPWRVAIRAGDLTQVRAARQLAQTIAAQANFWDGDLAAIEARLQAEQDAHTADAPGSRTADPTATPEPDAPFGGDDPALDKAVAKVATLPETRRAPRRTPAKEGK